MKTKRVNVAINTNSMGKNVQIIMNKLFLKHLSLFLVKILHYQGKVASQNHLFLKENQKNLWMKANLAREKCKNYNLILDLFKEK